MKLEIRKGGLKENQTLAAIGLGVVILIVVGIFVVPMLFGGPGDQAAGPVTTPPGGPAAPGAPPIPGGPPSATAPGAQGAPQPPVGATPAPPPRGPGAPGGPPPGQPPAGAPPPRGPAAGAPPAGKPSQTPASPVRPGGPARPGSPTGAAAPTPAGGSVALYGGAVTVSYPQGWGIRAGAAGSSGVITNGKGFFEVRAPDPKATTAKAIADAALAGYAKNAKPSQQGQEKIGPFEGYFYVVNGPLGTTRIVGIDASTRVVLFEYVKGGQLSAMKPVFDSMESELKFK